MFSRLRAGQPDGRLREADDDFEGWVKTTVLFWHQSSWNFGTM